ncbi:MULTISPECIES: cellulose biosynthesis cyclic di-GMP-binding regulatory protein BcsB [unclassified Pseudomonas]|uniref:cellulose biosynthesis cyclic di-GMP-binding regulatory protein BcsB n=1 Tax=unclassified Pseudomonas TaxID=196821 RepID=UPI00128DD5D6|nr:MULTISPECIES: cellulose biosynthesis cyclic di-GMP-binding regulatory protein BcsB [unclassified Pseudomonas]MPQ69886.1 cellulose biosynthesis cyclic di-GMP-binding regulatory protein BcsB [Pseudomonas sp. MWU12-2323]
MTPTPLTRSALRCTRRPLMLLASSALCLGGLVHNAWAETAATPPMVPTNVAPQPPAGSYSHSLTLKQLGRLDTMNLQGVEAADSVSFNVRADEVVNSAQLLLRYSYSPALLADLSQINVLVNDEVAASLALPKDGAGKPQEQVVNIPAHLITEFNRLRLQFIGHYTMQCEDPQHSSLWAKINNSSELELNVSPISLKDDLSILPLPFFDRRDSQPLNLPFVFAKAPDHAALEGAGALSSWLGALAAYRGASFTSNVGQLPDKGNAVVLVESKDAVQLGGLAIPAPKGPTVTLVTHPGDPHAKLLIVAGRDGAELKLAASAVALGSKALEGNSVLIEHLDSLSPRKPYDAPNWLPSDRPVKLGELLDPKLFSVSGYNPGPIGIPLRLPPDMFNWREEGVRLDLKYRYTPQQESSNSSLLVSLNNTFMKSMPLPSMKSLGGAESLLTLLQKDESLPRESVVRIPLGSAGAQSQLQLRFMFDYIKQGECRDIIIDNMRGLIDPDSTLDLTGYNHYIALPNLGVFNDSGFPFTRLADLSQSAVVLPDGSGPAEWGAYLTVLGRFGDSTGYPATAVQVVDAAQVQSVSDKDLLVLASGDNQPLLKQWIDRLPAGVSGDNHRFSLSDLTLRVRQWISPDPAANQRKPTLTVSYSGPQSSTYLAGFESPLKPGRSVVVIASGKPEGLAEATAAMIGGDAYKDSLQGSLAVVQGKEITSLVADEQYYVGELNLFKRVQWLLSQNMQWMLLVTVLGLLLVASLLYLALRARAKKRLS